MTEKQAFEIKDGVTTAMTFAVLANSDRFCKHRHAWKVWRALKEFGCKSYLVAPDLLLFEHSKVYPDLGSLKGKVDVVVPCLREEYLQDLVSACAENGVKYIWFQENNWTRDFQAQCEEKGVKVLRGCILKHRIYNKPLAFFNPCYWHGRLENKVAGKNKK